MTSLRDREIKIKVREDEASLDAIKRYMKKKGYEYGEKNHKGDYVLRYWYNDFCEIWVGLSNVYNGYVTFKLDGNGIF